MVQKPDEKRRIVRRIYNNAELRIREIFNIPVNESVLSFEYDKSNSCIVLKTLIDCNTEVGDK